MPHSLNYYHVDAFTTKLFQGYPIVVLTHVTDLTEVDMQLIATELKSNSVFLLPSFQLAMANYRLRHFTEEEEVDFSIQDAIACMWVLSQETILPRPINGSLFYRLELPTHDSIALEIRCRQGEVDKVYCPIAVPTLREVPRTILDALEILLGSAHMPIMAGSTIRLALEAACVLVPISPEIIRAVSFDSTSLDRFYQDTNLSISLISRQIQGKESPVVQRTFRSKAVISKATNCDEAIAAAVFLLKEGQCAPGINKIDVLQASGLMNQGELCCEIFFQNGVSVGCKVGGATVMVSSGTLLLNAH
ncbi:PhzF family phenazine biosynthesis protein [bacterium]|nr:PhzF family phenazine biosynthesis protein [bacterium]